MSFEDEYAGRGRRQKNALAPFLPVIGFLLAGIVAVIAFFVSDPIHQFLIRQFRGQVPTNPEVRYIIAVAVFLVLILLVAMIYAIFAPKPPKTTSEKQLEQEKREIAREKAERKKRKALIKQEAARQRRRNDGR